MTYLNELRSMCIIHLCTIAFGYTELIASLKPERPSTQKNNTSVSPLFLRSFSIPSQNLEDSFAPMVMLKISFSPSKVTPNTT